MKIIDKEILNSARIALEKYLHVRKDEEILLVTDGFSPEIIGVLQDAARKSGFATVLWEIEETGGHGKEPDAKTAEMMKRYPVVVIPAKYSMTHTQAVRAARQAGARVATLPGIEREIFVNGLKADPEDLKSEGGKWQKRLKHVKNIRLVSGSGSVLNFTVSKYPFLNDCGDFKSPGTCGNLPSGEVFTAPDELSADGELVVDGTIGGMNYDEDEDPVIINLKNGRIVSIEGSRGRSFQKTLSKFGDNSFFAAEFGIGTNPFLSMTGNLLGDEKIKGTVHIAFGNNTFMGGSNNVACHIDCLICRPDLYADDVQLIGSGLWVL